MSSPYATSKNMPEGLSRNELHQWKLNKVKELAKTGAKVSEIAEAMGMPEEDMYSFLSRNFGGVRKLRELTDVDVVVTRKSGNNDNSNKGVVVKEENKIVQRKQELIDKLKKEILDEVQESLKEEKAKSVENLKEELLKELSEW